MTQMSSRSPVLFSTGLEPPTQTYQGTTHLDRNRGIIKLSSLLPRTVAPLWELEDQSHACKNAHSVSRARACRRRDATREQRSDARVQVARTTVGERLSGQAGLGCRSARYVAAGVGLAGLPPRRATLSYARCAMRACCPAPSTRCCKLLQGLQGLQGERVATPRHSV